MNILVISGSLNPESRSRVLCERIAAILREMQDGMQTEVTFLDLREHPLPFCDGDAAYDDPAVDRLSAVIKGADAILVGVPIYNYDINAAVKNLVELTGDAWENKVVGFLCAAGGRSSYMSVSGFANDLMFDFRCLIIPRFIYAVESDFQESGGVTEVSSASILERLQLLATEARQLAEFRRKTPVGAS